MPQIGSSTTSAWGICNQHYTSVVKVCCYSSGSYFMTNTWWWLQVLQCLKFFWLLHTKFIRWSSLLEI